MVIEGLRYVVAAVFMLVALLFNLLCSWKFWATVGYVGLGMVLLMNHRGVLVVYVGLTLIIVLLALTVLAAEKLENRMRVGKVHRKN